MFRALWVAKTGLESHQFALDNISNNLANANTYGYKRTSAQFEDLMYQNYRQAGASSSGQTQYPIGLQLGSGSRPVGTSRSFNKAGEFVSSETLTHMAISGPGFFQIQMPDGTTAYTRSGAFSTDANGNVVTPSGYPLIPGINLGTPMPVSVTIDDTGNVNIKRTALTDPVNVGQIQIASFPNADGLLAIGSSLFIETPASGNPTVGTPTTNGLGSIAHKFLEASNVNVAEEMVLMIQTQRAYELNTKVVQAADQMLQKLTQL